MNRHGTNFTRDRGIALLMALVVVVLLTTFITEFFFSSALELRAMQNFREAREARSLARLAFKAVQIGLLTDEVELMKGYRQALATMGGVGMAWNKGLLLNLTLTPLDGLFNLNELSGFREDSDFDRTRWALFQKTMAEFTPPARDDGLEPEPLAVETVGDLYASLFDWIDSGDTDYIGAASGAGAEISAYLGQEPEVEVKNGKLDMLTEIRLVKGVAESGIPWLEWSKHFAAIPKSRGDLHPGRINVNVATREELINFLEGRLLEPERLVGATNRQAQDAINKYAEKAEDIAGLLIPQEGARQRWDMTSLKASLQRVSGINSKYADKLFEVSSNYYRVKLTTAVSDVEAHLEAVVWLKGEKGNAAIKTGVEVLHFTLE